ncbi:ACT domain-containing protein [Erythrobacter jejuensis]|uniref:ACT domain-containing protein n=2 Tax=Parerythrobacter jejuensis TaxID=795812 RepID=A0A845AKV5_9SPHN|nr:ACT domain-containing protein [Parerythrobacter jejuensis]MXP34142.1 ACT domain-containing protein [Parerythrobacter jejuensis]
MIRSMDPVLDNQRYIFTRVRENAVGALAPSAFALIHEAEGWTAILPATGEEDEPQYARITLMVSSALDGVGLTAAVASVLAANDIACNVVAALEHDHIFVPVAQGEGAVTALKELQAAAD